MSWSDDPYMDSIGNRKNLKAIIRKAKENPCTDCCIEYPYYVMEFDHLDRSEKLFNISQYQGKTKVELLDELSKCELVCANCHRIREHNRY